MCGICGEVKFDTSEQVSDARLRRMADAIKHRGPDDAGYFVAENVGIAMRRLSIIDLSSGHQPISNERGNLWIVFNGEIYNYLSLRDTLLHHGHTFKTRSDTETILHAYEQFGSDCVKHLRGMFAFAIWDSDRRILFGARDRLGIKPFYYAHTNREFLFGSEIKAITAAGTISPALNENVLPEYLAFGYTAGTETFFRGINKIPPGHTFELSESGKLSFNKYWDPPNGIEGPELSESEWVDRYKTKLEECVEMHLIADVPVGVFLSGGLDSSAVAALMQRHIGSKLSTFAVGYEEAEYSELPWARRMAKSLNSDHSEILLTSERFFELLPTVIWHEDEPVAWPSSVALFAVAKLAREHVKVVLTGEGSDETLGGYSRYAWTVRNAALDRTYRALIPSALRGAARAFIATSNVLSASVRRKLRHTFLGRDGGDWTSFYFDNFYSAFSAEDQRTLLTRTIDEKTVYENEIQVLDQAQGTTLKRLLYTDLHTYLVELLMKQDNMSMAASIESRVPFLDHELVELAMTIPSQYAIRGFAGKEILKKAMRGILPDAIIDRKKLGFPTAWQHWLSGPALSKIESTLLSDRAVARGIFNTESISRLVAEHRRGHQDNNVRIWRLLNLELWQRIFLDGEDANGSTQQIHSTAVEPRKAW
jgi:asparagine synthase (glutamine-hydrolysing)